MQLMGNSSTSEIHPLLVSCRSRQFPARELVVHVPWYVHHQYPARELVVHAPCTCVDRQFTAVIRIHIIYLFYLYLEKCR